MTCGIGPTATTIANRAWRCEMRCLECGAEIAERAQVCARCGSWAPVEYQLYVTEDRAPAAADDAAGGPAPAAIHADVGQQRPESAPDPGVDAAGLADWAGPRKFRTTRLRPGYDIEEVDAFLGAIWDTFLGIIGEPSLTPDEIRVKQFSTTRLRPGYDEEEVDAFLDEAESRLAARVSARREAPAAGPESGAADPAAEPVPIRCLECGAGSAAGVQVCARCGAPIAHQVPVSADRAEGESGEPIAPLPGESVHQTVGQRPGPSSRRNALIMAGLGLVVLVAVTVVMITRLSSSRPSASSASAARSSSPGSAVPSASQASVDELLAGDCLTGSDLGLDTSFPWPDLVTVVPCTQQHIAEVFFAGNVWPQSLAYPGDDAVATQADDRCTNAFAAYVAGNLRDIAAFTYTEIVPDDTTWPDGDRSVACVAYEVTDQYPGGAPVNYSIKGSNR